ncbi:MAG: FliG C-terminal domain-containing protein [Pirellulales bacterium]
MAINVLDQFRANLVRWWADLSSASRWTVAGLITIVLFGGVYLFGSGLNEPDTFLFSHDVTMKDLERMQEAFRKAGLDQHVVASGRIKVPRDQQERYYAALADAEAHPREFDDDFDKVIAESSFWETREQRQARLRVARQRVLSRIVATMKGIARAYVLFDEGAAAGLRRKPQLKGSVSAKAVDDEPLSVRQVIAMRNFVSGAIAGLEPNQVTVTDLSTGQVYAAGQDAAGAPTAHLERKVTFERQWTQKIKQGLDWVPDLRVSVDVTVQRQVEDDSASMKLEDWVPTDVKVALSVPVSYLEKVWRTRTRVPGQKPTLPTVVQVDALGKEIVTKLRNYVLNQIPQTHGSQCEVQFFDVLAEHEAAGKMSEASTATTMWESYRWVLLAIAAMAIVVWLNFYRHRELGPGEVSQQFLDHVAATDQASDPAETERKQLAATASRGSDNEPNAAHVAALADSIEIERVVAERADPQMPTRLVPRGYVTGLELNDWTGFQISSSPNTAESEAAKSADRDRLKMLEHLDARDLAQMLADETAQVVAIVFSHLDPVQAADVLKRLPEVMRVEVVRKLSNLDQLSDDVVREIEEGLESWLADQLKRTQRRNAGIRAVSSILEASSGDVKRDIFEQLRRKDAQLTLELQGDAGREVFSSQMNRSTTNRARETSGQSASPNPTSGEKPGTSMTFEDVIRLDDATLRTVVAAANPQVAILALAGATGDVVERLIKQMKPREADRLRGALHNLGPTRLRDVETSQRSLADIASRLDADGKINLRGKRPL